MQLETVAEIFLAVAVHEFSHILAMLCMGFSIGGIRLELCGLRIDYADTAPLWKDACAAIAGPVGGLVFYMAAKNLSGFISASGQFSLVYSLFNLLPVLPLDGGRFLRSVAEAVLPGTVGEQLSQRVSLVTAVMLLAAGTFFMLKGEGNGLFAAGMWLMIMQS